MKCPQCKAEVKDKSSGCEACELFQCAGCKEWVSWDLGGEDDEEGQPLCNNCWVDDTDDETPDFDQELDNDWADQDDEPPN